MVLNVHIACSSAFILCLCGGSSFTTVIIFCNSSFNNVDASLSIMFNFSACPEFFNVSYKTFYTCNISASLLVLVGTTKMAYVSYAYSINMY